MLENPLMRLQCGVNSYDWGKKGSESSAARYAAATAKDLSIQADKPYAEVSRHHRMRNSLIVHG